jgi:hypothetical protein
MWRFFYEKTPYKGRMESSHPRFLRKWIIKSCLVSKTEPAGSSAILLAQEIIDTLVL